MTVHEQIDSAAIDPADWVTLWQSELAALAVDRECHEQVAAAARSWTATRDAADGRPGPDAPAGSPAPVAPLGVGDELERLRQRIAELELAARTP